MIGPLHWSELSENDSRDTFYIMENPQVPDYLEKGFPETEKCSEKAQNGNNSTKRCFQKKNN